ncbi:MAG: hypothetical protein LBN19_03770 [Endomicrobium sp.]|nr:hypothetical protein [Endomicrobium sp.]
MADKYDRNNTKTETPPVQPESGEPQDKPPAMYDNCSIFPKVNIDKENEFKMKGCKILCNNLFFYYTRVILEKQKKQKKTYQQLLKYYLLAKGFKIVKVFAQQS